MSESPFKLLSTPAIQLKTYQTYQRSYANFKCRLGRLMVKNHHRAYDVGGDVGSNPARDIVTEQLNFFFVRH
jgi:hypothetical protein